MFIRPNDRVPVTLEGNTIYIKAKMDVRTRAAVENEISAVQAAQGQDGETEITNLGSYSMALLVHNIVAWEGPGFVDEKGAAIACNKATICQLDPDEPLVQLVREAIGERNKPKESNNPN